MELGIRGWLILIGVLLIVVVLLDAFRRYRQERRNTIRMAKMSFGAGGGFEHEGSETYGTELPAGGARVVRRDLSGAESDRPSKPATAKPAQRDVPAQRVEPSFGAPLATRESAPVVEPGAENTVPEAAPERAAPGSESPQITAERSAERNAEPPEEVRRSVKAPSRQQDESADDEVIVLNVIAGDEQGFRGTDLLQILLACDVRYGDMNIFHRHEGRHGEGPVQFSIANAVEPGTFDLDGINELYTPGITFFMQLPGPQDPGAAFDCMLETARVVVKNLEGKLLDGRRSIVTAKTLAHDRARIQNFARRSLVSH